MAFTWAQLIPEIGEHYAHVVTAGTIGVAAIASGFIARKQLGHGEVAIAPSGNFSIRGLLELLTEFIDKNAKLVLGDQGKKFTPLFAGIFLIVYVNNMAGFIPGVTPASEDLNFSLAMAVCVFLGYNYFGFKEHGIAYLKQLCGPMLVLAPLMIPIEIISHIARPISMSLRLGFVMKGDHIALGVFQDLIPLFIPILIMILGLIVCFVQAFVLTLLAMVYVSLATSHDH
jgi:F-type H+-transporting ATPase subunit a